MLRRTSRHFALNVYIFSPNFASALFRQDRCDPQQVENTLKREKFFAYDRLIFPVNINNNHWVVVAVIMTERRYVMQQIIFVKLLWPITFCRIQYCDSLGDTASRRILDAIQTWLREEAIGKEKSTLEELCDDGRYFEAEIVDVPQQTNVYDCGVHVCMNMFALTFDIPYFCRHETQNRCREIIGSDILRGAFQLNSNWFIYDSSRAFKVVS